MEKKFSILALVVTAVVTAVISGVIGGDRLILESPKPSLTLLSVGFQGPTPQKSVKLPDEIVDIMRQQLPWDLELERFYRFDQLIEAEQKNRAQIAEANELLSSLENWKAKYIARPNNIYSLDDVLPANALVSHPYFTVIGLGLINTYIRRGGLAKATYTREQVSNTRILLSHT